MRTLRTLLLLAFVLIAATTVFYAIQQQKSLKSAREAAAALEKERNELRKKLWDLEKRRGELEAQMKSRRGGPDGEQLPPDMAGLDVGGRMGGPGGEGGPFGRLMAMMDNPEVQRLMAMQQRGALDSRYAALFKSLNLTPAQLEQFKNLLVEKRTSLADVMAAARSQGLNGRENRDEIRALVQNAQSEIDASIRSAIGEAAYAQYQSFEQTQPERNVASQLQQRLSYSDSPLTDSQVEQLVQLLSTTTDRNVPTASSVRAAGSRIGFGGNSGALITDQTITQATTVLSASQAQALQQLQQEQQAQAQLAKLMREQLRNNSGNSSTTTNPVPPKG